MKLEAEFHAANVFWQEARERVLRRAHYLCVPLELKEHDDEFLYDLFDNGATIPTDEQIDKALWELLPEVNHRFPCYVCTMKSQGTDTPRCARYKECHLWLDWAKKVGVSPEVKPQAPLSGR